MSTSFFHTNIVVNNPYVVDVSGELNASSYTDAGISATDISAVVIGTNVTQISGEYLTPTTGAFYDCSNLKSVVIPSSVTILGSNENGNGGSCFEQCTNLTSVTLSEGLKYVGTFCFKSCKSLQTITIPDSVTSLGGNGGVFDECSNLTTINIDSSNSSITNICNRFAENTSLNSFTIPKNIVSIGNFAFYKTNLSSITIPAAVTTIGVNANLGESFSECSNLTSVTFESSGNQLMEIMKSSFQNTALEAITIPAGVTRIGRNAFQTTAKTLVDVTFEDPKNIGTDPLDMNADSFKDVSDISNSRITYQNTTSLNDIQNLTLRNTITNYFQESGFSSDSILYRFDTDASFLIDAGETFSSSDYTSHISTNDIGRADIGSGVITIDSSAFQGASNLSLVTISSTVKTIKELAFADCSGLIDVTISDVSGLDVSLNSFTDVSDNSGSTITFQNISSLDQLSGNLTTISSYYANIIFGASSFYLTDGSVINIDISGSLTRSSYTNEGIQATDISAVVLNTYITELADGDINTPNDGVFDGATSLKSITISSSVTKLGNVAFRGCSSLTSITIPGNVKIIGENTFENSALNNITIPNGVTLIDDAAFKNTFDLSSIQFAVDFSGISTIFTSLFENSALKEFNAPNSITDISTNAFLDCSGLTSVTLPDTVSTIGTGAFQNTTLLSSFTIPNDVSTIEESLFQGSGLQTIDISNNITAIGVSAFQNTELVSVFIPQSVTKIDQNAFFDCSGLIDVTFQKQSSIKDNVDKMYANSFTDVSDVTGSKITYQITDSLDKITNNILRDTITYYYDNVILNTILTDITDTKHRFYIDDEFSKSTYENDVSVNNVKEANINLGVTSIANDTFLDASNLTMVTISDTVTSIGSGAFNNCQNLNNVTISNVTKILDTDVSVNSFTDVSDNSGSVIYFGYVAGYDELSTTWQTISTYYENVQYENSIFYDLNNDSYNIRIKGELTKSSYESDVSASDISYVIIGAGVTNMTRAFQNSSITHIDFPYSTFTSIGGEVFKDSSLNSIVIPTNVQFIGPRSFDGCTHLVSCDYNNNQKITLVHEQLFRNCTNLSSPIIIPTNVTKILTQAFQDCTSLSIVTMGNSVTEIINSAFINCTGITSIQLSNTLRILGGKIFQNSGLQTLFIPRTLRDFGSNALNTTSLLNVMFDVSSVIYTSSNTYPWMYNPFRDNSNEASSSVTFLGINSFTELEDPAKSQVVPKFNNVFYGGNTFYDVNDVSYEIISEFGVLSKSSYVNDLSAIDISSVEITTTLRIDDNTFEGAYNLLSVTLGDALVEIGNSAFLDCSAITSITIPDAVTSIGDNAFQGSTSLSSVTLGDDLTTIGSGAFLDCSGLSVVIVPDASNISDVSTNSFTNLNGLASYSGSYIEFQNVSSLEELQAISSTWGTISTYYETVHYACKFEKFLSNEPIFITVIGELSLQSYVNDISKNDITKLTISESVTDISNSAFNSAANLTEVSISNSVTYIAHSSFSNSGLISVTIPENVQNLGYSVFQDCSDLSSVTILSDSSNILMFDTIAVNNTNNVFNNCTSLNSVSIPNTVTGINSYMFQDCTSLTSITLPENLEKIAGLAFKDTSLNSIVIPNTVTSIGFQFNPATSSEFENNNAGQTFSSNSNLTSVRFEDVTKINKFLKDDNFTDVSGTPGSIIYFGNVTNDTFSEVPQVNETNLQTISTYYETSVYSSQFYYSDTSQNLILIEGELTEGSYSSDISKNNITKLIVNDGVNSIGQDAFKGALQLTSVTINDTVTSIGSGAFLDCSGLTNVTITDVSLIDVSTNSFTDLSGTDKYEGSIINFPSVSQLSDLSVEWQTIRTYYELVTFAPSIFTDNNETDHYISIVGELTREKYNSTVDYQNIVNVQIAPDVTSIGTNAFNGAFQLTSVTINDSVTSIGDQAFRGTSIETVTLPSNLNNLGSSAFVDCDALSSVDFTNIVDPSNILSNSNIFQNCSSLTSIDIPTSVNNIGSGVFQDTSLNSVVLYEAVTSIGENAFQISAGTLIDVSFEDASQIVDISTNSFTDVSSNGSSIIHFSKPANLELFTDELQEVWTSITNYYANQIFNSVFYSSTYSDGLSLDLSGVITTSSYDRDISKNDITKVEFGSKVTSIDIETFRTANALTEVFISENVVSIGENAFNDCSGLATVTIADVSGITTISSNSFTDLSGTGSAAYPGSTITFSNVENWIVLQNIWSINGLSAEWFAITYGFENQIPPRQLPPGLSNFNIPNKVYGELPFQITPPDSSSNGAFSYDSSNTNIAEISGNIITIKGAGVTTITAIQEETPLYFGGSITASFEVIANDNNDPTPIDSGDGLLYMLKTDATYANIQEDINFNNNTTTILISNSQKRFVNETDTNKKITG